MPTFPKFSVSRLSIQRYKWRTLFIFGTIVIVFPTLLQKHTDSDITEFLSDSEMSEISSASDMESISRKALDIAGNHSFVMVTLINEAYMSFALSWLCNTKYMNIHQYVLFLTTDSKTDQMLHVHWPGVKSVILQGIDSKRNESYSQVGYVKLMIKRTIALMSILDKNIAIFLFEVDCLWLRNPVHLLQAQNHVDIVATAVSNRESVIAGGFLYLFPNSATKKLWKALTNRLLALSEKIRTLSPEKIISEGDNDQQYLSLLVREKYEGIRVKILPAEEFPDGNWYKVSTKKRLAMNPYIINNNWVIGNTEKIKRAKDWKHWFLREDNICDEQNVKLVLKDVTETYISSCICHEKNDIVVYMYDQ